MLKKARSDRFASVYFDPMDVMRDDETRAAFTRMLRHAASEGWEVTTLAECERRWRDAYARPAARAHGSEAASTRPAVMGTKPDAAPQRPE